MKITKFSHYLDKLEKTTLRNEITAILADLLKKSSPKEIDKICYLVLGELAPSFRGIEFNLAEKMVLRSLSLAFNLPPEKVTEKFKETGDLGETALALRGKTKGKDFSVQEIYHHLLEIALEEGEGSQERKLRKLAFLFKEVDKSFLKYLARIPVGKLRLGFSEITILDALSWMKTQDKSLRPKIERAFNIAADIGLIAKVFKTKGLRGIEKIQAKPGTPILAARAERLPTAEKIMEKLGTCFAEPKFDGFRVQIHIDRRPPEKTFQKQTTLLGSSSEPLVAIFSRNLENITDMFPDVVKGARALLQKNSSLQSAILDGEAIGYNPKTKKFLPFQKTVQRKRKYDIGRVSKEVPLLVFVFDILFHNGKTLLKEPFSKRRKILEKVLVANPVLKLTPQKKVSSAQELKKEFQKAIKQGLEGLVCKKINAVYQAGARNFNWVKYKKSMESKLVDTIDCVVMGYYRGRGKRAGFGIGAFLVGIYNPQKETFDTIAKIGTGLSDKQWQQMRKKCDQVKVSEKPKSYRVNKNLAPDVWCRPQIVVEIQADEITKSPIHTAAGGLALRFPRLKRFRDKLPEDATTTKEVLEMYQIQTNGSRS